MAILAEHDTHPVLVTLHAAREQSRLTRANAGCAALWRSPITSVLPPAVFDCVECTSPSAAHSPLQWGRMRHCKCQTNTHTPSRGSTSNCRLDSLRCCQVRQLTIITTTAPHIRHHTQLTDRTIARSRWPFAADHPSANPHQQPSQQRRSTTVHVKELRGPQAGHMSHLVE